MKWEGGRGWRGETDNGEPASLACSVSRQPQGRLFSNERASRCDKNTGIAKAKANQRRLLEIRGKALHCGTSPSYLALDITLPLL
jgi:hypothetical protein